MKYLMLVDDRYGASCLGYDSEEERAAALKKLIEGDNIDPFGDSVFFIDEARPGGYDAWRPEVEE